LVDQVIWLNEANDLQPIAPQTLNFTDSVEAFFTDYIHEALLGVQIPFKEVDRIQIIASPDILKTMQQLQTSLMKDNGKPDLAISGSVYSRMQCMLKGVCAQCLQWQINPETGKRKKAVFACSWQDQPLALIDTSNIKERAKQNQLTEHLHNLWVDYLFETQDIARV